MKVRVGMALPGASSVAEKQAGVDAARRHGVDHAMVGDHISFFTGIGFDGLVNAASLLSIDDTLPVYTGVYLLALRHPVLVARQLADIAAFAPGRLTFGVGVGGEDRHEVESCGVDPSTRGRRMDECLVVLRRLLAGEPVTFDGEFFQLDDVRIRPSPSQPIPIVIGGRSAAAVRRAGRLGDGWLGIWVSPSRFASVVEETAEIAEGQGREVEWQHAMQLWCGFGEDPEVGRLMVAPVMEAVYQTSFDAFARYTPTGSPEQVAEHLQPYVDAGCRTFNLIAHGGNPDELAASVGEVRRLLGSDEP